MKNDAPVLVTPPAPGPRFVTVWAIISLCFILAFTLDGIPHAAAAFDRELSPAAAADIFSNLSRTMGVSLSMLVALCALAIPLTANVWSPKLIEIFLADRWNMIVLGYFVLGNGVILWNQFVVTTLAADEVRVRVLVCLALALVGISGIAPYFLYVLRFLVPRSIVHRLEREILLNIAQAKEAVSGEQLHEALEAAIRNVQYLGKITLRSIERYDRDTAYEGLSAMRSVFDHYQVRKEFLPRGLFKPEGSEVLGLGPELSREVQRQHATVEVAILQEFNLLLPIAMPRLPEIVAKIAALTRHMGVRTAQRGDAGAREMAILHFNTFLRRVLKDRQADSFYKFVYQYRRMAEDILEIEPEEAQRIAFYLDYYGHQAVRMGMHYLINVVAYDLASLCYLAYRIESPGREELLTILERLDRDRDALLDMPGIVKAQLILAAKLRTRGETEAAERLLVELKKVPEPKLKDAFSQIVSAQEHFWEIGDRRRHLDHIEPRYRRGFADVRKDLLGDLPQGRQTQHFLRIPDDVLESALSLNAPPTAARKRRPSRRELTGPGGELESGYPDQLLPPARPRSTPKLAPTEDHPAASDGAEVEPAAPASAEAEEPPEFPGGGGGGDERDERDDT